MDHAVNIGVADRNRLGIGGWSYGGILTDYTIASDQRFKAAISGAGSALQLSMYGVDQYTFQYDKELGPPWRNSEAWMKVSYPSSKPTAFTRRHYSWAATKISTYPWWAANRCIRLFELSEFRRSLSFIPANSTDSPGPALFAIAMSAISPGMTSTSKLRTWPPFKPEAPLSNLKDERKSLNGSLPDLMLGVPLCSTTTSPSS